MMIIRWICLGICFRMVIFLWRIIFKIEISKFKMFNGMYSKLYICILKEVNKGLVIIFVEDILLIFWFFF